MQAQKPELVGEYTSPEEDLLLRKFFDSRLLGQDIIDSFDSFINEGIQECFNQLPLSFNDQGQIAYLKVDGEIRRPHYTSEYGVVPLNMETAKLHRLDYTIGIPVKVVIKKGDTVRTSTRSGILFEQCIMKYSQYCWDRENIEREIENPTDPGCYFFLDGLKVMPMFDKMRQNQIIVATDRDTGLPYAYHLSETTYSTNYASCKYFAGPKNSMLLGITLNKSEYSISEEPDTEEVDDDEASSASSLKKPAKVVKVPDNALSVMYTILYSVNKGITQRQLVNRVEDMLSKVIPKNVYTDCHAKYISTRIAFMASTHDSIIEDCMKSLGIETADKNTRLDPITNMRTYFAVKLLPNVLDFEDKVDTLIMIMSYLLQRIVDPKKQETDKNHWGHKGLSRPREILSASLSDKLNTLLGKARTSKLFRDDMTADQLLELLLNGTALEFNLTKSLQKDFKPPVQGMFFKSKKTSNSAITIDVIANNAEDLTSILFKIRNNVDKNTPSFSVRNIHPSSYKITDPFKFTENEFVGIHKFAASMMHISNKTSEKLMRATLTELRKVGDKTCCIVTKEWSPRRTVPVLLNGSPIGYANIDTGYNNMRMYKRYGIIDRKCCIVRTIRGTIEVYCDSRRVLSPVVCTDVNHRLRIAPSGKDWSALTSGDTGKVDWKKMTFNELVRNGYIEYLDAYEYENPDIVLAQTFASFKNYEAELARHTMNLERIMMTINEAVLALSGALSNAERETKRSKLQINYTAKANVETELKIMKDYRYTHAPLHPAGGYTVGSATLPFINHEMACRGSYGTKHTEQKMTKPMGDLYTHASGFLSAWNTTMSVAASTSNLTKRNELIAGQTVTVALKPMYANQDDACVVSKDSKDKLFKFNIITVIRETCEDGEYFGRYNSGRNPHKYRNILKNGLPLTNVEYHAGDCVLGRYKYETTGDGARKIVDRSYYLAEDEVGVVTEVVTYRSKQTKTRGGKLTVSIRLSKYTSIERAGKVTTQHAQKYETALILPATDMPFNELDQRIDIMFSPMCFPTRMTYGTLAEPILGRASALTGKVYDMACHKDHKIREISRTMTRYGFSDDGEQLYYDGVTGEPINLRIFTGPANVAMLIHVGIKKTQVSPGLGAKHKLTNQVESTRTSDKGQKFGGPERNKALQYGASFVISERMNISSDGVTMVVCRQCSAWANFNPALGRFQCTNCDSSNTNKPIHERFGKYIMPQTAMYIQAGLRSIRIEMQNKFVSKEEYLNM